ncbi:putative Fibronectin type III domain-containing protein [Beijerinckiaceae bacterium RH AL1]|nr:hypothetical protein [Beijerinckiaceae bacterium]VVB47020.1 putative Fibronectin type III domain-containing protein [Beijerinckiaceae bacterium RH CH11]VVB47103.1 putative Fibronectin type III domain-containing protein [Beijerinckiaceae bacterium RH AL8]VVC55675.1 putative Fibronectin type III domain-containing protein [Beijerinckiaceae bacterium RH AL1]
MVSVVYRVLAGLVISSAVATTASAQITAYQGGSTLGFCSASDTAQVPVGEGPWISASQSGTTVNVSWGGDGWNKWHFRWGHPGGSEAAFEYGGDQKSATINEKGFCQRLVLKIQGCVNHIVGHDRCSAFQETDFTTDPQRPSGGDTCAEGFVWREAYPNDHVCVSPAVRSQAAADNARHQTAPCPAPLVPRMARRNDTVCVSAAVATATKQDNTQICRRLVKCP